MSDLKASEISKLRAQIEADKQALKVKLGAVVPECFQAWLQEAGHAVIHELVEHGLARRTYRTNRGGNTFSGYGDIADFGERVDSLEGAWVDVVEITITWKRNHVFEVVFKAI